MERRDITDPQGKRAKREVDSAVSWADLPPDIVIDIADHLTNLDSFAFRSVCSSWRRSVSFSRRALLSPFLPVKVPQLRPRRWELNLSKSVPTDCVLSTGSVYILRAPTESSSSTSQSSGFFLLFAEEFVERRVWLRNPLSTSLVSELPYSMPKNFSLLEFDGFEVAKCYSISSVPSGYNTVPPYKLLKQVIKVVVCSNVCAAVVLCDTGILRVLNIGLGNWEILHEVRRCRFDDIVEYEGKVFGVDRRGKLYTIEYDGLIGRATVVGLQISGGGPGGGNRKRLVVSSRELYLLVRFLGPDVVNCRGFKVFRLKLDERKWVRVTNLGDWTFFVGVDLSFSISTEGFRGECKKNCILFTEESFPSYQRIWRVYLHKSSTDDLQLVVYCLGEVEGESTYLTASPTYSSILWPPPSWLQSKLSTIELLQTSTERFTSRIQGAINDRYLLGHFKLPYCEQQCLDYAQYFEDTLSFVESELNASKPSLLKRITNHQDKMNGVNCRNEENHEAEVSDVELVHSTWEQSEVVKLCDMGRQAVSNFKDIAQEIRHHSRFQWMPRPRAE